MNADKRRAVADCKQVAIVGLACKNVVTELFDDTDSPVFAGVLSGMIMLAILLIAYGPTIAFQGG